VPEDGAVAALTTIVTVVPLSGALMRDKEAAI
jgi:hypothetical protein